jgi:ribosome-binding ATPase
MSLSVGIVGLPNVGKSTLFNALLKKQQALVANYPFATIEPNVGIVPVPDNRLEKLAETIAMSRLHFEGAPRSKELLTERKLPPLVPATVKFIDIAGLVKGAAQGEGLGNQFLAHIRETDVMTIVVRAFQDTEVVETGTQVLGADLQTVITELAIADLQNLEKQREPRPNSPKQELLKWATILKAKERLNSNLMLSAFEWANYELVVLKELSLLTIKPVIYVVNVGESQLIGESVNQLISEYSNILGVKEQDVVVISAKVEAELASLDELEQRDYLQTLGMSESSLERLIRVAYKRLGLISFLTAGEIECRAWTIRQGDTAIIASGVIHTDFMKKFIKVEVVPWEEFVKSGGWAKARTMGKVRSEGRDYVMQDGEVVEFKIGG